MTKAEIITALDKAKRHLSVAKEQDEKEFAQKRVTKLEAQLSELAEAVSGKTDTVDLLAKIEKAKRHLSVAKEQDEKDFAQKKLDKLQAELGAFSDVSKATAEVQAENKEVLKEVANVVKNDTIPAEIKPKLIAKIKEEAHASMEEEKKAIKEFAKAKTKPKKAQAKVRLEKAKERKKNVKDLAVTVSRKHDKDKFKDLMKRLTDTGKYDFLKGMSKEDVERDMKRLAKPMGWRFRGKGNYKNPNRAEIKAGVKSGKVYYETRPERSDVSKTVRLKDGGLIEYNELVERHRNQKNLTKDERLRMNNLRNKLNSDAYKNRTGVGLTKANHFSKGQYVWVLEQGGITDMVLSQSAFEEVFDEMKSKYTLTKDEPKLKVFSKNASLLVLKLKEIYSYLKKPIFA